MDLNLPTERKARNKYLVENKKELIAFKKSAIKHCDPFGKSLIESKVQKSQTTSFEDNIEKGLITRKLIGNTYNWMDSHYDVHLNGLFDKSINEKGVNKIWHLHDHLHQITAKVGRFKSITEEKMSWTDLGINKTGETQVLSAISDIEKAKNENIFSEYLNGDIDQHSVGMMYVKIELAVNDPDMKEEFEVWNKYIGVIGNANKANEVGFFWAVKEAKLVEISAVLEGSNELTPTIENQPQSTESSKEAVNRTADTLEREKLELLKSLNH